MKKLVIGLMNMNLCLKGKSNVKSFHVFFCSLLNQSFDGYLLLLLRVSLFKLSFFMEHVNLFFF